MQGPQAGLSPSYTEKYFEINPLDLHKKSIKQIFISVNQSLNYEITITWDNDRNKALQQVKM